MLTYRRVEPDIQWDLTKTIGIIGFNGGNAQEPFLHAMRRLQPENRTMSWQRKVRSPTSLEDRMRALSWLCSLTDSDFPLSRHHFFTANPPLPEDYISSSLAMTNQLGSVPFQGLLESALLRYEKTFALSFKGLLKSSTELQGKSML